MKEGESERVVDSREYRDAFAAVAYIDEADHERLRDAAKTDAADRVQIVKRIEAEVVRDAADIEEWRELQNSVGAEDVVIPDPRPDLGARDREVVIDETPGAIATQRLLIRQQAFLRRPDRAIDQNGVSLPDGLYSTKAWPARVTLSLSA